MVAESCQLLTPIIVIAGWFFVDWRTNKRELRKEKRALIDKIHLDLNAIEQKAVAYHQSTHSNEQLGKEIKVLLNRLISVLNREKLISQDDFSSFSNFRKAITLNNFDSSAFVCQPDNSELLDRIYAAKDQLIHNIETKFNTDFR